MKHTFNCFYDLTDTQELEKIWKDKDTLFIFDTNVLLSLYAFQPESRKDFLKVLSSIKDRIWIPFHVGLEFQKNRLTIIKNRRSTFNDLNKDIDKLSDTLTFDKKPFTTLQNKFSLKKNYLNVFNKLNESLKDIDKSFINLENELKKHLKELKDEVNNTDKEKIFVNSKDFIREEIDNLFTAERVGKNIFDTAEKLNALYKEGNDRYKNKIPPGYEDEVKGEEEFYFDGLGYKNKFGDLMIFKQIIEYSKEKLVKNVIFISEDIKKDWRHVEDQGGDKILGARIELKRELYKEAGVENFLIYQIEDFVKKTNEYLNIQIEDQTLKSIKLSLEEDKHQRAIDNFDQSSKFLAKAKAKLNKLYDSENVHVKAALDNHKLHHFYDDEYIKAALEAQKLHSPYDDEYIKAALEAQKLHSLYDDEYIKAALEAQKLNNPYNDEYIKAALEAQKLHNPYIDEYAKVIREAQKLHNPYIDEYAKAMRETQKLHNPYIDEYAKAMRETQKLHNPYADEYTKAIGEAQKKSDFYLNYSIKNKRKDEQ